jgi:hypothetical protein
MFARLGRVVTTHPGKICALWLLLGVALGLFAPSWNDQTQDDDIHFLPARCDSVRGYEWLKQAFPQDVFASRAIFVVERKAGKSKAGYRSVTDRALDYSDYPWADKVRKIRPGWAILCVLTPRIDQDALGELLS